MRITVYGFDCRAARKGRGLREFFALKTERGKRLAQHWKTCDAGRACCAAEVEVAAQNAAELAALLTAEIGFATGGPAGGR